MYGRGDRLLTQPAQSTAPGVGPGTYRVDSRQQTGESYAPFQCMALRESFLTVGGHVAAAPGPAHYTPTEELHVKGGDSLQSKAGRFNVHLSYTPGPGTYSVSKKSDWLRKTYPPPSAREEFLLSPGLFRSGRLTFTRKPTAPSIPIPGKNHGYGETEDGSLTPQPLPEQDSTMGPAYYNVSHESTATTTKYKGVHFGKLQALRTQFKGREGPGPGDYHSRSSTNATDGHPSPSTAASQPESLPRYHILVTRQEEKKAVPGPGQYTIHSQFEHDDVLHDGEDFDDEEEEEHEKVAFGSREKRFLSPKYHSPACTSYQDPRSALSLDAGRGRAPFGQTSLRFRANRQAKEIPGPGAYNNGQMTSLVANLSKKSQYHGAYKCPFGSTAVRTAPLIKRDEILGPGPAHYQRQPQLEQRESSRKGEQKGGLHANEEKLSYTFASTTSRLYSPPSIVTDIPPPGSYEVSESYTRSQDGGGSSSIGRGAVRGAFLSSSSRSAPPRDILLEEPDSFNPGPGEYESQDSLGKGKPGLLCYHDKKRFKTVDNGVPGPGAYTLSKTYKDTVLHGTYNVSLHNPLTADRHSSDKITKKQSLIVQV